MIALIRLFLLVIIATPAWAAPDAEQVAALRALAALDQRVHAVGYRLASANAPYCRDTEPSAGLMLHHISEYGDAQAARAAFGFADDWMIAAVAPDSPAARAGLMLGDRVIGRADDRSLFTIQHGNNRHSVRLETVPVCATKFRVNPSTSRGASADGEHVTITSTLVEYMTDGDELAAVLAHELAHNLLGHRERLDAQKVNRGFFGQLGKSGGRIRETEIEADRLSVWLMANAGYDPAGAIRFWTRYGKEHGKGIFSASTHYRWKKRVGLFEEEMAKMATVEAVDGKRAPPLLAAIN